MHKKNKIHITPHPTHNYKAPDYTVIACPERSRRGQLKSINNPALDETTDPGQDGKTGSTNAAFGKDVFGLALDYHTDDYKRTSSNVISISNGASNIYNGMIREQRYKTRAVTNSVDNHANNIYGDGLDSTLLTGTTDEIMHRYAYDDEYRLITSIFGKFTNNNNNFTAISSYKEWGASAAGGIEYDANGNITGLKRNAYIGSGGLAMDNLTYNYTSNTNQLASITDAVSAGAYGTDFDASSDTYTYNSNGQMVSGTAEGDIEVYYYNTGLTKKVTFGNNNTAEYWYDDRGQKIKTKYHDDTSGDNKYTWYVNDASGNTLAIYEYDEAAGTPAFTLIEEPIYGSGRIATLDKVSDIIDYEITDHLGNVRATIKGISQGVYELTSRTDYYAFGGAMPGRSYQLNSYRYNYQGQENAVNDNGTNWQAFELRMHSPDLGRWMSPDPYGQYHSPYISMGNNPVSMIDPDGGYVYNLPCTNTTFNFPDMPSSGGGDSEGNYGDDDGFSGNTGNNAGIIISGGPGGGGSGGGGGIGNGVSTGDNQRGQSYYQVVPPEGFHYVYKDGRRFVKADNPTPEPQRLTKPVGNNKDVLKKPKPANPKGTLTVDRYRGYIGTSTVNNKTQEYAVFDMRAHYTSSSSMKGAKWIQIVKDGKESAVFDGGPRPFYMNDEFTDQLFIKGNTIRFEDSPTNVSSENRSFRANLMLYQNGKILFSIQWGYDYNSTDQSFTPIPYIINYNQ